jgi:hypothetical protein
MLKYFAFQNNENQENNLGVIVNLGGKMTKHKHIKAGYL